ncbi:MAG TPA: EipA family protein, partial [Erythrobacter sp.]|nr:EipA family protein [Erythrobacter sp.]
MTASLAPTNLSTRLGRRLSALALAALAALALSAPVAAQELESFDPDQAYDAQATAPAAGVDGDLAAPDSQSAPAADPSVDSVFTEYADAPADAAAPSGQAATPPDAMPAAQAGTYAEDDLIGAAEGVFGKGAEGLAKLIQDLLKEQGQPNGYIVGREAGGAF